MVCIEGLGFCGEGGFTTITQLMRRNCFKLIVNGGEGREFEWFLHHSYRAYASLERFSLFPLFSLLGYSTSKDVILETGTTVEMLRSFQDFELTWKVVNLVKLLKKA